MASIYHTDSGSYVVQWDVGRDRKGKRIRDSRTFDSEARAIAFKVELEDLRGGTGRDSLVARRRGGTCPDARRRGAVVGALGSAAGDPPLGAYLGLRRGEIVAPRWQDVDFGAMTVTIARSATQPTGRETYFKAPKTESGIRTIAMLEPTAVIPRAQKRRGAEWRLTAETCGRQRPGSLQPCR